ncbi:MAG: PfkB family carbohydrate kinase [Candidatus Korobacteraceae bacterium]
MTSRAKHRRQKGLFVGLATVDVSYTVDEIPRRNQKISVEGQRLSAGGPSANAATTFAFLGGRASLVTAVGGHPLSSVIRDDAERFSITLHDLARERTEAPPVSSIMVLRRTGERTVVSANAAVFSASAAEFNPRWLSRVSIVQVDGHYMKLCIAAALAAHERGIPVVLDSGSWKKGMSKLLRFVDIAICSDDYRPPGCRDAKDVFEFLGARGIRQIAITRGANGIRFVDHQHRATTAVPKIRAVDTLGAGDIFHGAFCYYISQRGNEFRDALSAAAKIASFSCRYPGTRSWMQKFSRLEVGAAG